MRIDTAAEIIDTAAEIIVYEQSSGMCHLGKVCEPCDCFASNDAGATRDAYARDLAGKILLAIDTSSM